MYYLDCVYAGKGGWQRLLPGWHAGVAKTTGGPKDVLTGSIKWKL